MSPIHIPLVQDNEGEIILTPEASKETTAANKIFFVSNGELAIKLLDKEAAFKKTSVSGPILPGLYLPGINGKEVSPSINTDSELKKNPLAMVPRPASQGAVPESYQYHANNSISVPVELDKFFKEEKKIENFRFPIVYLLKTNLHGA